MAIDTAAKRASVFGIAVPALLVLPFPDGAVDAGDRLHVDWLYRGIAASTPVPVLIGSVTLTPSLSGSTSLAPVLTGSVELAAVLTGNVTLEPE